MRSKVVKTLALALVLSGAGIGPAQQQPRQPGQPPGGNLDNLECCLRRCRKKSASAGEIEAEEMLAEALKNNLDIRFAAAKLAEADAELNRTRVQVTQKVVTLFADEIECGFFVREYGILVVAKGKAPPGAMAVEEFLSQKPAEK